MYRKLRSEHPVTLVFSEASDEALIRRFSETRRPHPLAHGGSIADGIHEERRRMAPIRRLADVVIDTTKFNVHELRQFIIDRFQKPGRRPLMISVVSFGFRYGVPARCRPGFRRALSSQSAFRTATAAFYRKRSARGALHPLVSADWPIPAAHREPAGVSDPALYPRREKLSHRRAGMHRRAAPLRGARRGDPRAVCRSEVTRRKWSTATWTRPLREEVHSTSAIPRGRLTSRRDGTFELDCLARPAQAA